MITIFNRRELTVTFDSQRQAAIRDVLARAKVDYKLVTRNRDSASALGAGNRHRTGTLGQNLQYSYTYTFYVRRADYEKAKYLLGQC